MSGVMAVVAWLAVLNPFRTRLGLPERDGRGRMEIVGPGVILGVGLLVVLAAGAGSLLDTLEISPEMFRIAAGLVLLIAAAWMAFRPVPTEEPLADGMLGALWPVAYPRIVSPEAIVLALTTGASDGVMVGPMMLAGAAVIGLGAITLDVSGRRVSAAFGRLLAAVVVLVAVVLAIEGIRQV
jgi:small neutral amino acid transporter SnatA (MarC family)